MYHHLQPVPSRYKAYQFWKQISFYLLLVVISLFFLNTYELMSYDFQARKILYSLKEQKNKEMIDSEMTDIQKMQEKIDVMMDRFRSLVDQEQYLLIKIKESHIQDNKEQDQIPQITNFENRLSMYRQILNEKFEEFKRLSQNIARLKISKNEQIKNESFPSVFKEKSEKIVSQLAQFQSQLIQVLKINQKWSKNSQENLVKSSDVVKQEQAGDDIEDLPQYYNLPPLAKQILRPLPIQLLKKLYSFTSELHEQSELQIRQKFYKERQFLAKQNRGLPSFSLSKYNIQSAIQRRKWQTDIINNYAQVNKKYSLQSLGSQLGFCIIVPTYNNAKNFRAELNLNSIFSQNYTNYKVVIIDDASKDKTPIIIEKYLKHFNISQQKCELIVNKENKKALQNIYLSIIYHCDGYQIATIVDGDDELIGYNVLKVLNAIYTRDKLGVVYSSFYFYHHITFQAKKGFNSEYQQDEKLNLRAAKQKFSHLISFQRELLKLVDVKDLQYNNGKFYNVAYDFAMMYPIMQLSCKRIKYIDEFQYLYSIGTGMNDYEILQKDQQDLASDILKRKPYQCSEKYDNHWNNN